MNSAVDLPTSATISHPPKVAPFRSRTVYFWIGLALFGLVLIGGVEASHYTNIVDAPYVGP